MRRGVVHVDNRCQIVLDGQVHVKSCVAMTNEDHFVDCLDRLELCRINLH